ncbi:MAG: hypothetical protein V1787_02500, partial [Candidatus Micrarchaeota archaeon]
MRFYVVTLSVFLLFFLNVTAFDNYPWINTFIYDNLKDSSSYTSAQASYVADHFDFASVHVSGWMQFIKQRNPDIRVLDFTGLAEISTYYKARLGHFLSLPENQGKYAAEEIEGVHLHYKCDAVINGITVPGCNARPGSPLECTGTAAPECAAIGLQSSAHLLGESRMQDPDPLYQSLGWTIPNFNSRVYRDFGPWRANETIMYYPPAYPADGLWFDNILFLGSNYLNRTVEYWSSSPNSAVDLQYNDVYHDFFSHVKQGVEQYQGRQLVWLGNVNNMYWIRHDGPYVAWMLANLRHATPESWVSPIQEGEYAMPFWDRDCSDLAEAWNYSVLFGVNLTVFTYNHPRDGAYPVPDPRTKASSIAKYYLVKNDRLFYGYAEDGNGLNDITQIYWNKLAEVDIGFPRQNPAGIVDFDGLAGTDKFFNWNSATSSPNCNVVNRQNIAVARFFTNGLVLARWKAVRCTEGQYLSPGYCDCGPACSTSYADARVYSLANEYNPSGEYYRVAADGTLSAQPANSVTLATNEAALLFNVCAEGEVPSGSACGCGGEALGEGGWCCGGQPRIICRSDSDCINNPGGGVCFNPATCDSYCGLMATPTPTSSPTPTPEPCSPDNSIQDCTVGACSGTRLCTDSSWGECIQLDLCCGVECEDGNSCTSDSCSAGACSHANICGGSGGGYSGGGYYGTPPPTPRPSGSAAPSSVPSPRPTPKYVAVPESDDEVEAALDRLPYDEEKARIQEIISQAKVLEKQGRMDEARLLWMRAKERVAVLLENSRNAKISYNYLLAGLAVLVLVASALYYSSSLRGRKPPEDSHGEHESVICLPANPSGDSGADDFGGGERGSDYLSPSGALIKAFWLPALSALALALIS